MCGRYVSPDDASIEREFNLVRIEQDIAPSYNVAPTQQVPIIRTIDGAARLEKLRWGLIPFFAKGGEWTPGASIGNAVDHVPTEVKRFMKKHVSAAPRQPTLRQCFYVGSS